MRPLPAFSMLQFDPIKRSGKALSVPRHTPVEAKPVRGVTCRFRTAYATEVLPLELTELNYSVKGDGALLSLRLGMTADGHLARSTCAGCGCTWPASATSARCSTSACCAISMVFS